MTLTGVQPVVRNDIDLKDTTTFAAGWNTKYENADVILNLDASYSTSDRRLQQIESYSGLTFAANPAGPNDTLTYNRTDGGFPYSFQSSIDYSNTALIQLTDPRGWGGGRGIVQAGFINDTNTDDELWAGRAEVVGKINQGFVKNLVAGVAYSDRSKSRDIIQNFLSLPGPSPFIAQGATTRLAIPGDALYDPRASLAFLGFGPQVTYNPIALIENGTYVLTEVQSSDLPIPGDWTVNEKVYTAWFPQCCAPTLITRDMADMDAFLREHGRVVCKPLYGMGGRSIFVVDAGDKNANVIFETLTEYGTRYAIVQRYIPDIVTTGDSRVILVDGEPVPFALARIPTDADNRGNLAAGGRGEGRPLSDRDRWIAAQVGPELKRRGMLFVGLDVIGDYLTEVNVTSPTCVRELDAQFGLNIAGQLFDAIEARRAARG